MGGVGGVSSNGAGVGGSSGPGGAGTSSGGGRANQHGRSKSVGGWGTHHELQTCPDRPMSLFEGLAGAAVFLADMVPEAGVGERPWFPSLEL